MAYNIEAQGDEFIKPSIGGSPASSNRNDTCRDDSGDICTHCDGHGTVIIGEYDDSREVDCPRVRQAKNEADINGRVDQMIEDR